jgi:hypothetical protein
VTPRYRPPTSAAGGSAGAIDRAVASGLTSTRALPSAPVGLKLYHPLFPPRHRKQALPPNMRAVAPIVGTSLTSNPFLCDVTRPSCLLFLPPCSAHLRVALPTLQVAQLPRLYAVAPRMAVTLTPSIVFCFMHKATPTPRPFCLLTSKASFLFLRTETLSRDFDIGLCDLLPVRLLLLGIRIQIREGGHQRRRRRW